MTWDTEGIVRIRNHIPPEACAAWCGLLDVVVASRLIKRRVYETPRDPAILNEGGVFDHYIVDGEQCIEWFFPLCVTYVATRSLIEQITGLDVIISPHKRSAVNLNRYDAPGGQMSAHFDSNPISSILYLTTNTGEGATEFLRDGQPYRTEYPVAGDLLVFKGREISHCSTEVRSATKVAAIFNFYTREDQHRPEGMDEFMYGDHVAADALHLH